MYRKIIPTALACIALNAGAAQTLTLVEGAYELILAEVTFPSSTAGNLVFRMCTTCESQVMPVNSETDFVGPTGPMSLDDFRATIAEIRDTPTGNQETAVGVYYNLDTNRVTRVSVHPQ